MRLPKWLFVPLCLFAGALFGSAVKASTNEVRVNDDSGEYFAVLDTDTFGPFVTPEAEGLFAASAKLYRVADGTQVATMTYVVSEKSCSAGRGRLVWLNETGEPVGVAPWTRGADVWPTRVAEVLCARVPGA